MAHQTYHVKSRFIVVKSLFPTQLYALNDPIPLINIEIEEPVHAVI